MGPIPDNWKKGSRNIKNHKDKRYQTMISINKYPREKYVGIYVGIYVCWSVWEKYLPTATPDFPAKPSTHRHQRTKPSPMANCDKHMTLVPGRIGRGSRPGKCLQFASWNMGHRNSGFSHEKIVMFHCFLYVYQRVTVCELENHHL